jgi:hypothetical protein
MSASAATWVGIGVSGGIALASFVLAVLALRKQERAVTAARDSADAAKRSAAAATRPDVRWSMREGNQRFQRLAVNEGRDTALDVRIEVRGTGSDRTIELDSLPPGSAVAFDTLTTAGSGGGDSAEVEITWTPHDGSARGRWVWPLR